MNYHGVWSVLLYISDRKKFSVELTSGNKPPRSTVSKPSRYSVYGIKNDGGALRIFRSSLTKHMSKANKYFNLTIRGLVSTRFCTPVSFYYTINCANYEPKIEPLRWLIWIQIYIAAIWRTKYQPDSIRKRSLREEYILNVLHRYRTIHHKSF